MNRVSSRLLLLPWAFTYSDQREIMQSSDALDVLSLCQEMFGRWLERHPPTTEPPSWHALVSALEVADYDDLATMVKRIIH